MDGALADLDRDPYSSATREEAPGTPAQQPSSLEVIEMRLVYLMRANARVFQQVVRVPTQYVETRMFECVLEAWGKSRRPTDIEFVVAQEMNGETLATAEGLALYCRHKMTEAKEDLMQDFDWGQS